MTPLTTNHSPMPKATPGLTTAPVVKNRVMKHRQGMVPRSKISEAPYNPRVITDESQRKLASSLVDPEIGLVESLVWNERTGNLVGGHQRLGIMDAVHEGENYEVPVDIIDVDEATEKKINLMLNNHGLQGTWDVPSLETMFRDQDVDPFAVGFEVMDLVNLFPTDVVKEFIEKFIPDDEPAVVGLPGETNAESLANTADEIAEIKDARKAHKDADGEALRADHMMVVVFNSAEDASRASVLLRLPPDEQFFLADRFFEATRKFGPAYYTAMATVAGSVPPADTGAGVLDDGGLANGPTT